MRLRFSRRLHFAGAALLLVACGHVSFSRDDLSCQSGACTGGYVCDPETLMCVHPVVIDCTNSADICPDNIQTGDTCPSSGSFIPCTSTDPSDCSNGCRTCRTNGLWSSCSVDPKAAGCPPNTYNLDGTGCNYSCVKSGDETCNGKDDDCDGLVDDMQAAAVQSDCQAQEPNAKSVAQWQCTNGACKVSSCSGGLTDLDGNPSNGCEASCVPTNPSTEVCDGKDNNCDGIIDPPGSGGCVTYYADKDGDGHGNPSDSECLCAKQSPYTVTDNTDCDDTTALCTTDCADTDADGIEDCEDYCVDADDDGYGVTNPNCTAALCKTTTPCTGSDCDDTSKLCTTSCTLGSNGVENCKNNCVDNDGDGYGSPAAGCPADPSCAGAACTGADCDDAKAHCTTDCTDADGDGYCENFDCDEGNATCAPQCTGGGNPATECCTIADSTALCLPISTSIVLSNGAVTSGGGNNCKQTTVTINADDLTDPPAMFTCAATPATVTSGPVAIVSQTFAAAPAAPWSATNTSLVAWKSKVGSCATAESCGTTRTDDFLALPSDKTGGASLVLTGVNATHYKGLSVGFTYAAGGSGDDITLSGTCGATAVTFSAASFGNNSEACASPSASSNLTNADACATLNVTWTWPKTAFGSCNVGAIDDVVLSGTPIVSTSPVPAVTAGTGDGNYMTTVTVCEPADATSTVSTSVTCTWNSSVSSAPLVIPFSFP